jgi:glycosyltransferase involved in cell wall biosynthesis
MRTERWHRRLLAGVDAVCVARVDESCRYVLALKRRLGFRLSVFLHGAEIRSLQCEWRRYRDVLRWALREADVVVAVSEELRREAIEFEPGVAATATWIPNGVDVAAIRGAPAARRPRPYVLFAGRLERVKNPGFALTAFARAVTEMDLDPALDLVFAGVGSEEAALAKAAARSGLADRVHLLGVLTRPEVYALMRSAACLVVPSLAEGHPFVVLEAWAAGLPVLASDVKGLRNLVDAASRFPLDDGETLASLLVSITRTGARDGRRVPDVGAYDLRVLGDRHLAAILG